MRSGPTSPRLRVSVGRHARVWTWAFRRAVCALLLGVWWLCVPATARAEEPRRVVVGEVRGPSSELIRARLVQGLLARRELRVVSLEHVERAAERLKVSLHDAAGARKLGAALGIGAIVDAEVKRSASVWSATLRVRATADGEIGESHQFKASSARELGDKVRARAFKQLGAALLDAKPAASKEGKRVVVRPLTGPKAEVVRGWMVAALKRARGVKVVPDRETKERPVAKDATPTQLTAAADALGATAFVGGEVEIHGATASVRVSVWNGADGERTAELPLQGQGLAGLGRVIAQQLGAQLAGPLAETSAPMPLEQVDEDEDAGQDDGSEAAAPAAGSDAVRSDAARRGRGPSPLEVIGGVRGFSRDYRYQGDQLDVLRAYQLGLGPAAFLGVRWYPVAHFQDGVPAHLGLVAGFEQGFLLESKVASGASYGTTAREWYLGLRGRIPYDRYELGLQVSFGNHGYQIDDDPNAPLVPDVAYRYVRLGLDGRARLSRFVIGAHFGYRIVSDAGEASSASWFPHATVSGIDAGAHGGYEVAEGLDLLLGVDVRRYAYTMHSEAGDPFVADGALDDYLSGWIGAAYRLPGSGK